MGASAKFARVNVEVRGQMGDGGHRAGASPAPTIHEVFVIMSFLG